MADIKKTLGQLQTLYADNTNAEISPNDLRDGFKTAIGSMNVYATSTNYTADADDIVIEVDTSSGDVTITIPGANVSDGSGDTFNQKIFYIINTGANDVILSGGATNTVAANSTLGIISNGTSWLSINASGDTDLSEGTTTNNTVDVNSSTGTNATLAEASTTRAGVMSKAKFDEVVANTAKDGITTAQANAITANTAKDGITTAQANAIIANTAKNTNVTTNLSEGTTTNTTVDVNSSDGTNATLAEASTSRAGVMSKAKFDEVVANTAKVGYTDALVDANSNVAANTAKDTNVTTNLSEGTTTTTTVDVNSSDGTNATIAAASTSRAGVMSKAKFDEVVLNTAKNTNVTTNLSEGTVTNTTVDVNSSDGTNATLAEASTTRAGVMSKAKFDEVVLNTAKISNVNILPLNNTFTGTNTFSALTSLDGDATFDRNSTTFDVIGTSQDFGLSNLDAAIVVGHYLTANTPTGIPTGWTSRTALTITGASAYRKQVITNLNASQTYYGKTMSRVSNNATTSLTWSDWRMVGDVEGPSSSTDTAIPVYDGTTGKLIKDSGVLIDSSDNVTIPSQMSSAKIFLQALGSDPGTTFTGQIWRVGGDIKAKGNMILTNDITAQGDVFANDITATGTIKAAGSGTATEFLNGLGTYSVPAGGGGGTASPMSVMVLTSTVDTATFGINSPLIVPWNSEKYKDTGFSHSNSTNTTRAIVDNDGTYQIQGRLRIKNTVNQRAQPTVNILKNGSLLQGSLDSSYIRNATGASDYWTLNFVYEPEKLSATDYIEVQLTLDTGSLGSFTSSTLIGSESSLSITNLQGTKGDQGPAGGLLSSVGGGLLVDLGFPSTNQVIAVAAGATTINFDDTVTGAVDKNGDWDNTNKKFIVSTASGAGTYQFETNLFCQNSTGAYYNLQAFINGTIKTPNGAFAMSDAVSDSGFDGAAGTLSLDLDVGDEVEIKLQAYGSASTTVLGVGTWAFAQGMRISKTSGVKGDTGTGATADLNKALTLESPTASEKITIFRTNVAITVQEVIAVSTVSSGTPSTTYQLKHSTDRSATGNNLTNSGATTSLTTGDIATLSDETIPADSWIWFESTAASGTDVVLCVSIRYTED